MRQDLGNQIAELLTSPALFEKEWDANLTELSLLGIQQDIDEATNLG